MSAGSHDGEVGRHGDKYAGRGRPCSARGHIDDDRDGGGRASFLTMSLIDSIKPPGVSSWMIRHWAFCSDRLVNRINNEFRGGRIDDSIHFNSQDRCFFLSCSRKIPMATGKQQENKIMNNALYLFKISPPIHQSILKRLDCQMIIGRLSDKKTK